MARIDDVNAALRAAPRRWLVTGAAGFIGSHLVERLLSLGQDVVGVDNFATGHRENLSAAAPPGARFAFFEGDVADPALMAKACVGVDVVLHQAALGSVPRSLNDPMASHRANVDGFITTLQAARGAGVRRFVYASSSSVYGDDPNLPKVEARVGRPLSPYAATKAINELYADVFGRCFGTSCIGLRYFNVFGARQDPHGPYAAVIPVWVARLLRGEPCPLNGDGETSRDFCYVDNAVQANLLAAMAPEDAAGAAYNVAWGARTTLLELFDLVRTALATHESDPRRRDAILGARPVMAPFREGDVRHSLADISLARARLGYEPSHDVGAGLAEAVGWYVARA